MLNTEPWFLLHRQMTENTGTVRPSIAAVEAIQGLMNSELSSGCISCPFSSAKATGRGFN